MAYAHDLESAAFHVCSCMSLSSSDAPVWRVGGERLRGIPGACLFSWTTTFQQLWPMAGLSMRRMESDGRVGMNTMAWGILACE